MKPLVAGVGAVLLGAASISTVHADADVCTFVDAGKAWQSFSFPSPVRYVTSVGGAWTVDAANHEPVGAGGHVGPAGAKLEPYSAYKFDRTQPFGALLVAPSAGSGHQAVTGPAPLRFGPVSQLRMRINDTALGDNRGALSVCFSQSMGESLRTKLVARWAKLRRDANALGDLACKGDAAARRNLERAAADGNAAAMTNLGYLAASAGKGKCQSPERGEEAASRWYAKAAEAGYPPAMESFAVRLAEGKGVPRDVARSVRLLEASYRAGHLQAGYTLAYELFSGEKLPGDPAAAERMFRELKDAKLPPELRVKWAYFRARNIEENGDVAWPIERNPGPGYNIFDGIDEEMREDAVVRLYEVAAKAKFRDAAERLAPIQERRERKRAAVEARQRLMRSARPKPTAEPSPMTFARKAQLELAKLQRSNPPTLRPGTRPGDEMTDPLIGMRLCWVPPGRLLRGTTPEEQMSVSRGPDGELRIERHPRVQEPREAAVRHGFWMGKFEVTQAEYQEVAGTNPSHFQGSRGGDRHPADSVSWVDARKFLDTLNARERASKWLPEDWAFQLPSEVQWEYACRAGTTGFRYGPRDEVGWFRGNSGRRTHPVGEKRANAWGLHDTLGNVAEWCADSWHPNFAAASKDERPWEGRALGRVLRGGSYEQDDADATGRGHNPPTATWGRFGFRVVLAPLAASR